MSPILCAKRNPKTKPNNAVPLINLKVSISALEWFLFFPQNFAMLVAICSIKCHHTAQIQRSIIDFVTI